MKKFGFLTLALVSLLFTACDPTEETTDVKVTGLTLNKTSIELEIEGTERLTVVKTPSNATTAIVWKSSVDSVASVSSTGIVTALKSGTTTITASADGVSASCTVTVLEPVDFYFTQGEIYDYTNDPFDTGEETVQYTIAYLYTDGVDVAGFEGDGYGMQLIYCAPIGTGAAIPAGTYTFTDILTVEDAVPNAVEAGYMTEAGENGSLLLFFALNDPEYLEQVPKPGAYTMGLLSAGKSFDVSVEDGIYTLVGEFEVPTESGSVEFTFRFKGEIADNTSSGAPAAIKGVKTVHQRANIPWLKK